MQRRLDTRRFLTTDPTDDTDFSDPSNRWSSFLGLVVWLAMAAAAQGQPRPYIGYTYPAGGRQGTTFQIRLGGQNLDDVNEVLISGPGVKAEVVEYRRRLNAQEMQLLNEELRALKRATASVADAKSPATKSRPPRIAPETTPAPVIQTDPTPEEDEAAPKLIARIEERIREYVPLPASDSIASLVVAEVAIAPDAEPGVRELRVATSKGVSNPLVFEVGQLPEFSRKPMITATKPVLGKEEQALRKRPLDEVEDRVTAPCTLNGQIASGEINRYRFAARRGQHLVITTRARHLIPFLADAVPGWFQAVQILYDATGQEVAYDDDYRFDPDPTILYQVPKDGEYVLAVYDSIYRGREDFVYRTTLGELPFITSIFPLGARVGSPVTPRMKGWNLQDAMLTPPGQDTPPGIHTLAASRRGLLSNRVRFALDPLPDVVEQEPNNTPKTAQKVALPIIINGRIDKPDDWDLFQFTGKANETIVAEVQARRLDSPLDSVIKLTDATGRVLAFNDDHEDLCAGVNPHQADSYFIATLPANGTYYVHIGDTSRHGGEEYGYRLRLSAPQPDFELRVVPSSVALRTNATAALTVYVARKDGFTGPIRLGLSNPPPGFSVIPVTLRATQTVARLTFKGPRSRTTAPVSLSIVGTTKIDGQEIVREAVPAEDRMQAFLWRHLVPAGDLQVMVFDPAYEPPSKFLVRAPPPPTVAVHAVVEATVAAPTNAILATKIAGSTNAAPPAAVAKPRFTKLQIAARLRQLKRLYEDGLLTADFYCAKVAECEAAN